MKIVERAAGVAASPHSARAMKAMKVLNFVGTVRGAATTVLLAASMVGGGAVTVNQVRQEVAQSSSAPKATATAPRTNAPTPLTATSLLADLQLRLQNTLAADASAADDVRKVAVFSGPRLDQLVDETKQKLQARYDLGIVQLTALINGSAPPSASASAGPSGSPSVIAANALFTVIVGDLNTIVVQATRAATAPTPLPRTFVPTVAPTPAPTVAPTPAPTVAPRTPSPSPSPTRSASPRPSATR